MTLKDELKTDMAIFFNDNEFATIATKGGQTFNVIFDQTTDNFDEGDVTVNNDRIEILADQDRVNQINIVIGDQIIINTVTYNVIDLDDEGETISTGLIKLFLSKRVI